MIHLRYHTLTGIDLYTDKRFGTESPAHAKKRLKFLSPKI